LGRWRPGFGLKHGLSPLSLAEKEWIGLAAYPLLGWPIGYFPAGMYEGQASYLRLTKV